MPVPRANLRSVTSSDLPTQLCLLLTVREREGGCGVLELLKECLLAEGPGSSPQDEQSSEALFRGIPEPRPSCLQVDRETRFGPWRTESIIPETTPLSPSSWPQIGQINLLHIPPDEKKIPGTHHVGPSLLGWPTWGGGHMVGMGTQARVLVRGPVAALPPV